MFVIITYDISDEQRLNRVRKILRKYLYWVQLSTFEGEITEARLEKCLSEIKSVINESEDSVYVYKVPSRRILERKVIGIDKGMTDMVL
ncbi:MAG: CRISPR-associated endonuclease Cas2 [Aquificae bacterium]|nr:CRISPR-associated endonuclease Cas2 [Aquificota bacterium]